MRFVKSHGVECRAKKLPYIASMGIYVLKASAIRKLLVDHFPEVSLQTCHVQVPGLRDK